MIIVIIIGMALVTMVPRVVPAFLVNKFVFHNWVNRWLQAIPYAALGALIFPGILTVKGEDPKIGLLGGLGNYFILYRIERRFCCYGSYCCCLSVNDVNLSISEKRNLSDGCFSM